MNTENENNSIAPTPGEGQENEMKDTVSWIVNVLLKVGAGYLAKVIIDALGF